MRCPGHFDALCSRSENMARNVEIKARIESVEGWVSKVQALADADPISIVQDDTFFNCRSGRLKLRAFETGAGELIYYHRANECGPKTSHYSIVRTESASALREVLTAALGEVGRVRKIRTLFLVGRTRIHLDRVEGLGDFLELEVVLATGEPEAAGAREADELCVRLGISRESLVEGAYLDLLAQGPRG